MNGHPEYLDLVAASIDFDLTDEEFGRLSTHLARCPECRRAADELRGDAAAIAAYPAARLAPARSEQILRAALRMPRSQPRWGLLAVAAMLTTLGGGILFAGFQLVNDEDPAPSEPPPSLVAEASAPPSPTPAEDTAEPGAPDGGNPPAIDVPEPTPPANGELGEVDFEFPLPFTPQLSDVRVAPTAEDRLWVTFRSGTDTILAQLDEAGEGSPRVIGPVVDCVPYGVDDGSVRVLCNAGADPETCFEGCNQPVVLAYSGAGEELDGFPVIPRSRSSTSVVDARVIGKDLVTVVTESDDARIAEFGEFGSARLVTVAADGSVTETLEIAAPLKCCKIGPDGVAYGSSTLEEEGQELRTQLIAFDANRIRPGWPKDVDGTASWPSFGPNRQILYSSWIDEASRIMRLNPDGSDAASPIDPPVILAWSPDGDGPIPPLVDERGRAWVVSDDAIHGFGSDDAPLDGFPYEPRTSFVQRGMECGPEDTGCQSWIEAPRMAPRGLIYSLEAGPRGKGERITVINPDGSIRSGWPVTLQRQGATWDSVTIGENRTAYAVAFEPEPNNEASISILALAPNSERLWIRTIVEP
jgi:hypothetical protein